LEQSAKAETPFLPKALTPSYILEFGDRIREQTDTLYKVANDLLLVGCKVTDMVSTHSLRVTFAKGFATLDRKIGEIVISLFMHKVTALNNKINKDCIEDAYDKIIEGLQPQDHQMRSKKFTTGLVFFSPISNRPNTWELTRQPYQTTVLEDIDRPPNYNIPAVREKEVWFLWDNRFWLLLPAMTEDESKLCGLKEWVIRPVGPTDTKAVREAQKALKILDISPIQAIQTMPIIRARMEDDTLRVVGYPSADRWVLLQKLKNTKSVEPSEQILMKPWQCISRMQLERDKELKEMMWQRKISSRGVGQAGAMGDVDEPLYTNVRVSEDTYMDHPSSKGSLVNKPEKEKPAKPLKIVKYAYDEKGSPEWTEQQAKKEKKAKMIEFTKIRELRSEREPKPPPGRPIKRMQATHIEKIARARGRKSDST